MDEAEMGQLAFGLTVAAFVEKPNHVPVFDMAKLKSEIDNEFCEEKAEGETSSNMSYSVTSEERNSVTPEERSSEINSSLQEGSSRTSISSQNEDLISESENDTNDTQSEKMDDTFTGKDDNISAVDFNIKNRISMLHCYICGKHYSEPKLLNCLHSFCLQCLDSLIFYKHNQKIECCVCGQRTKIPDSDMSSLPTNVIIKHLLDLNADLKKNLFCDICILHGEERKSAGQCIDCNDMLCSECCEKHNYSRQTISHTVVSLDDITSNQQCVVRLRESTVLNCNEHEDEKLKFYCITCQIVVCRDCVLLSHSSHQVLTSEKVIQKIKDEIEGKIGKLNKTKEKSDEELVKFKDFFEEQEKQQKDTLETAYKEVLACVEEKYKLCLESLNDYYQDVRSRFHQRQEKIKKGNEAIEDTEKNIRYLLNQGQDLEIANFESLIKNQLNKLQNDFEQIKPDINTTSTLSFINIYSDNCMTLKKMTLFKAVRPACRNNFNSSSRTGMIDSKKHNVNQNLPTRLASLGLDKQPKVAMRPAGMWHGLDTGNAATKDGQASLLGEPPSDHMPNKMNLFGHSFPQGQFQKPRLPYCDGQDRATNHSDYSSGHKERRTKSAKVPKAIGQNKEMLALHTTLSVKVLQDIAEPDIAGMTFVGQKDFAVCDARNKNIKIFSICGKFLSVIIDYEPMTITFCDGHLVWNGSTANVLTKPLAGYERKIHRKRFQPDVIHPVTTFKDDKYLVANVQGKVVAFQVDGKS